MERIGARYEHCTLDNFDASDNPSALEAARELSDGSLELLLLFGGAGRGKTHLLVGAGRAYEREAKRGEVFVDDHGYTKIGPDQPARTAAFWPVLELVGSLRGCVGDRCEDPEPGCRKTGLLLLDDYGAETSTDFAWEGLQRLLDYRYRERKPVGISTNLTPEEWTKRYGDQMLSRLSEGGRIIRMTGRDRRPERGR
jgi:DNA replication protein DnaC